MAKNYYDILGVDKKASKDEIKKAFYKVAHKHHPDKKGGDEAKFKEASEAYAVLSDDKKRAEYDAYGTTFGNGGPSGGTGPGGFGGFDFSGFQGNFQDFDLGDIFGEFFGGGRSRVKRGRDISIDIELSFEEAVFGAERKILLTKTVLCDTCKGSGAKPGTGMKTCTVCNGAGELHETRSSIFGAFSTVVPCKECKGSGKIPEEKCPECKGAGVLKRQEEIRIMIPAGINNGEMIRMTGAGEAVSGGISGDLYIKVHVKRHPLFKKEGNDLSMTLDIKLSDALLGAEYAVKTLDGDIALKIPAGTSFGDILRVRGKGVPLSSAGAKGKRGDLLVKLAIKLPSKLSRESKKLLEELRKEGI